MNQVLWKDMVREIRHSLPRFLSILAIIMMGVAFFIGIRAAGPSMLATTRQYYQQFHMPHGWVQGTYGLNKDDLTALKQADDDSQWLAMTTVLASLQEENLTLKVYPWTSQTNKNVFHLTSGRAPQTSGEIVLSDQFENEGQVGSPHYQLGDEIHFQVQETVGKESAPRLQTQTFKVVGFVESPLYFERTQRGVSEGDGFAVVWSEDIQGDIYTEAYFWRKQLNYADAFTSVWDQNLERMNSTLESALSQRPDHRLKQVQNMALEDIQAGQAEIDQGYQDLIKAKQDLDQAKQELDDHEQQLIEAKDQLDQGKADLDKGQAEYAQGLIDAHQGKVALDQAQATLQEKEKEYQAGLEKYQAGIAQYKDELAKGYDQLQSKQSELDEASRRLTENKRTLDAQSQALDEQWQQLSQSSGLSVQDLQSGGMDPAAYQAEKSRLQSLVSDLQAQIQAASAQNETRAQLQSLEGEIEAAQNELTTLQVQSPDNTDEIESVQARIDDLSRQANALRQTLQASPSVEDLQSQLTRAQSSLESLESNYQRIQGLMTTLGPELQALKDGQDTLQASYEQYDQGKAVYDKGLAALNQAKETYQQEKETLPDPLVQAKAELDQGKQQLDAGRADLEEGRQQIQAGQSQLAKAFETLQTSKQEWQQGHKAYLQGQAKWLDGKKNYQEGRQDYETSYPDAIKKLEDGQKELNDARKDLRDMAKPQYLVTPITDDPVYQGIANNAQQLNVIANIFPVFFLAIAVLVTYSTIKRMTQEQRNFMGTLKQVGYSDQAILSKFIVYAGLAATCGIILGLIVGYKVFPPVVLAAYNIMYRFNRPVVSYSPLWMMIIAMIAYMTAFIPAYGSPKKLLQDAPVTLLRPQAPRSGNKTFVEKLPWLWRRLSFKRKMTIRNLLRYKGRNLMTLLGVAGCTMLIVTGFGISNTISGIVSAQFDEIQTYDAMIVMDKEANPVDRQALESWLSQQDEIQGIVPMSQQSIQTKVKGIQNQTVTALIPLHEQDSDFRSYFHLHERHQPQTSLAIQPGQIIMTERLEEFVKSQGQGTVPFVFDGLQADLPVQAITENYIGHYIYMRPDDFEHYFKTPATVNAYYIDYKGKASQTLQDKIAKQPGVMTTMNIEDMASGLKKSLGSLDLITLVLVISAAGLAFVVLYNLTNINIAERLKELATIKVLGFYAHEVSLYIYDEILVLTFLGSLLGLGFGYGLTHFIMKTMQLNNVLFYPRVHWDSYLYSFALTFVFSGVVMALMHRKIRQIDMVEALKAVE